MDPNEYYQEKVAPPGSDIYYSLLFASSSQRKAAIALYALEHELLSIRDECSDPAVALAKLQWWQTEILAQKASHPITQALQGLAPPFGLDEHLLHSLTETTLAHLNTPVYANPQEWVQTHYQATSAYKLIATHILGHSESTTLNTIHDLDICLRLITHIQQLRTEIQHHRVEFTAEELKEYGIDLQDLHSLKMTAGLKTLLTSQANRARKHYQQALLQLSPADYRRQLPSLIRAKLAMILLKEIEHSDYAVLQHTYYLTPLRKLWLAWRTKHSFFQRKT